MIEEAKEAAAGSRLLAVGCFFFIRTPLNHLVFSIDLKICRS